MLQLLRVVIIVAVIFCALLQVTSLTEAKGKSRSKRRRGCPKACVNKFNSYQKGVRGSPGSPGPRGPRGAALVLPVCKDEEYLTSDGIRLKCVKFDLSATCRALNTQCVKDQGTVVAETVPGKMIKFMSKNVIQHMRMNAWDTETFYMGTSLFMGLSQMRTSLEIYRWESNGATPKFKEFEELKCPPARNWAPFKINNVQHIVIATWDPREPCPVYRWETRRFVNVTALKCSKAFDVSTFNINGAQHVAFTNFDSAVLIYKWTGAKFYQLQKINILGMYVEFYTVGTDTHLVISGASLEVNPFVYVFRWNRKTGKFVQIQKIDFEQNTRPYQISSVSVNKKYFLAVATIQPRPPRDQRGQSKIAVYKWSGQKYELFQNISSRKARRVATISSPLMGRSVAYLAVVNYNGNPEIYAMDGDSGTAFTLLQDLQGVRSERAERARDINFFVMDKDVYLILTTSDKFLVYRGAVV